MAYSNKSVNKYAYREEDIVIPDSAGANVVTVNGSTISDDLSNKKFLVEVEVTEVSAGDGALDVKIEASLDGTTFVSVDASLSMDVDNTGLNKAAGIADLTNIYAPYYRIVVFTDGTDILDAGTATVKYAFKL